MIRKLRELLHSPELETALVCVGMAFCLGSVQKLLDARLDRLAELEQRIAEQTARLRQVKLELGRAMGAEEAPNGGGTYPTPEDLDPLHHVGAAEHGALPAEP